MNLKIERERERERESNNNYGCGEEATTMTRIRALASVVLSQISFWHTKTLFILPHHFTMHHTIVIFTSNTYIYIVIYIMEKYLYIYIYIFNDII